ncbi:MFS transporter [Cupriavidus sp. SS-3]|uniref:MFS transporter n=1 Tax=Cupriavidus sp. SS-3 TaxID=3109596 RepID=UPI002DB6169D|nr:MFS transporter [Cupriavidus sp. SS-3]MEC3768787.1 MFS transporter [Cupriavidus sp. SS-3]
MTAPPRKPVDAITATAWGPLRNRRFSVLWSVWVAANVCVWMCDVAAAWLMTTLTDSKTLVALVQTATALPAFLLALPGGALADQVDRRRWFLVTLLCTAATTTALAVVTYTDTLNTPLLLALVFAGGVGAALRWPAFSALLPEVVSRPELPQAMALHGLAVHGGRVGGPLVAGLFLAMWGGASVFFLGALLSLTSALVIWKWDYEGPPRKRRTVRFPQAIRAGLRYAWRSCRLRAATVRIWVLFTTVTALMALLPLLARAYGIGSAMVYTTLLACVGAGAMTAVMVLPRLRARFGSQRIVTEGSLVLGMAIAGVGLAPHAWLAAPILLICGAGWIAIGNSLNVSAQLALPDRLRARGMAVFFMAAMGGGASGAAAFGALADHIGVRAALLVLALMTFALACLMRRRWSIAFADGRGQAQS